MIVLSYEPRLYVTIILEPSCRSHYLHLVDQVPCRDNMGVALIRELTKKG